MFRKLAFYIAGVMLVFTSTFVQAQTSDTGNTATVIFYRAIDDGGRPYGLTSQNKELAKLKKGEHFEQVLAPGTYYYMADPSTTHVLKLDVDAGQTYYVLASKDGNYFSGQPTLRLGSAEDYQKALAASQSQ